MDASQQARLLLFVWAGVILLFFTIESGSRLEYYSFGAWPAISMLLGLGIAHAEETDQAWLKPFQRVPGGASPWYLPRLPDIFSGLPCRFAPPGSVSSHLVMRSPENYLTGMVHLLDLTPQSVADLRIPVIISSVSVLIAFVAAWILRERGIRWLPNIALALGMVGFIVAAHIAHDVLNPTLSSRSLALELNKSLRPDDQIALYGDIHVSSGYYVLFPPGRVAI